jgi:hypothetical protein
MPHRHFHKKVIPIPFPSKYFPLSSLHTAKNHIIHLIFTPPNSSMTGEKYRCRANKYRYGFNGQEKEKEITGSESHTSAEFWMYDTRLARRWEMDPKPNVSFSPYSCFQLNPIFYFDTKGDTVGGDMESYNTVKNYCVDKVNELGKSIEGIKDQIAKAPTTGESVDALSNELNKMESEKSEFNAILEEYKALENSTDYYEVIVKDPSKLTEGSGGSTGYNSATGHIDVVISSTMPLFEALPHELKHAYQFETEMLDFSYNGRGGGTYDLQDEVEAYKRGQFFGYYPGETIDAAWVVARGYSSIAERTAQIKLSDCTNCQYSFIKPSQQTTYKQVYDMQNKNSLSAGNAPKYIYKGSKRK